MALRDKVILALVSAVLAAPASAQPPASVAITHAVVIPMTSRGVLEDQTVLIHNGRIAAMGPASEVALPVGVRIVDGAGKFLIPGLTDAHVHLYDVNDLDLYLMHGVTAILNMSGAPVHLEWREAVARGALLGPALFTTGPQLKVDADPAIDFERSAGSPSEVASLARIQGAMGYDFAKVWGAISSPQYTAFVNAAQSSGMRVTGHIPSSVGLEGVIAAGQSSVGHVEEYYTKVFGSREIDSAVPAAVEATRAGGLSVITTLITYEAMASSVAADPAPLLSRPGRQLLDPVRQLFWEPTYNTFRTRGVIGQDRRVRDALRFQMRIAQALSVAGVPLLAGTDAGGLPGLVPGLDLHRELELLVEAGLDPWEALRAATREPGDYLAGGDFGTVAVGVQANLVLLDANPLASISNTRRIAGVVVAGRYLGADDLHAMRRRLDTVNRSTGAFVKVAMAGDSTAVHDLFARTKSQSVPSLQEAPVLFLAQGLRAKGNLDQALQLMRLAAEAHPRSYLGRYMLAGTLIAAGRPEEAKPELEAVLQLRPDHDGAAAMVRSLRR